MQGKATFRGISKKYNEYEELSLKDIVRFAFQHWKSYVLVVLITAVVVHYTHRKNPSYSAASILVVKRSATSPFQAISSQLAGMGFDDVDNGELVEKYMLFLRSRTFFRRVTEKLEETTEAAYFKKIFGLKIPKVPAGTTIPPEVDMREVEAEYFSVLLAGATKFEATGPDSIAITVKSPSRYGSVKVVNHIANIALNEIIRQDLRELDEIKLFVEEQIQQIEIRMLEIDRTIVTIRTQNSVPDSKSAISEYADVRRTMKGRLADAQLSVAQNNQIISIMQEKLAKKRKAAGGFFG